jgi:hypothetical protein
MASDFPDPPALVSQPSLLQGGSQFLQQFSSSQIETTSKYCSCHVFHALKFAGNLFRQADAIQTHRAEVSQTLASLLATKTAREAGEPSCFDLAASVPNIELSGCVFVGHTATDMDSIASAIGAAELFQGTAARASDINTCVML